MKTSTIKTTVIGLVTFMAGLMTVAFIASAREVIPLGAMEDDYNKTLHVVKETEKSLNTAKYRHCLAEKELANGKMQAHLQKQIVLDDTDFKRLSKKIFMNCYEPEHLKEEKVNVEAMNQVPDTVKKEEFNLDCLAVGVATAETGNFTKGSGVSKLNGFGVMFWPNGVRTLKTYATKQESIDDFKRIWSKFYGGYPTYAMAKKWTGNDHVDSWQLNVKRAYNGCIGK